MGNAIMSFYSALIDLLGRCAPEMHVCLREIVIVFVVFLRQISPFFTSFSLPQLINKGKGEALRIRAILRSLVPTEDLVGIISIPLKMPIINKGTGQEVDSKDARQHTAHLYTSIGGHTLCLCYYTVSRSCEGTAAEEGLHIQCRAEGY